MGRNKVEYKCKRCNYTTNRKSRYLVHLARRTPCQLQNKQNITNITNIENIHIKDVNKLQILLEEYKLKFIKSELKLEQTEKSNRELIITNQDIMTTNKGLMETNQILVKDYINMTKTTNKTIQLLIRENKKLTKSVEKHKTMNMWGCSKVQLEWLKLKSIVDNTFIISRANSEKEHSVDYLKDNKNKKTRVDGFSRKLNKIYEFQGDYYHGNPKIYKPEKYNKKCKKTFGELYKNTVKRTKLLEKEDYVVEEMWENDWNLHKKLLIEITKFNKIVLIKYNIKKKSVSVKQLYLENENVEVWSYNIKKDIYEKNIGTHITHAR